MTFLGKDTIRSKFASVRKGLEQVNTFSSWATLYHEGKDIKNFKKIKQATWAVC
jgi:hypothetical protein